MEKKTDIYAEVKYGIDLVRSCLWLTSNTITDLLDKDCSGKRSLSDDEWGGLVKLRAKLTGVFEAAEDVITSLRNPIRKGKLQLVSKAEEEDTGEKKKSGEDIGDVLTIRSHFEKIIQDVQNLMQLSIRIADILYAEGEIGREDYQKIVISSSELNKAYGKIVWAFKMLP